MLSSLGFNAAQEPTPKVDRSGEPALIKLMDSLSKRKLAHYSISTFSRNSEEDMYFEGNHFDVVFGGPKRVRITASSMWGDGRIYISDGKTLLLDYLDISQGVLLKDVGKSLMASDPDLDVKGSYGLVTTMLFQGPEAIEKVASKASSIIYYSTGGPSIISIQNSEFGNLKIFYRETKSGPVVIRCEYDNWDYKQTQHEKYPEWVDAPEKGTMDVEVCRFDSKKKVAKNAFSTLPAKNLTIRDERKKDKKQIQVQRVSTNLKPN